MTVVVVMMMKAERIKSTNSFTKVSTQEILSRAGHHRKSGPVCFLHRNAN
jgi:hypothetical protein